MSALAKLFDILPGWAWAIMFGAATLTAGINASRVKDLRVQIAESKSEQAAERERMAKVALRVTEQRMEAEREAQDDVDKIQQEKSREIQSLNRKHAAVVNSLRNRQDRPTAGGDPVPKVAESGNDQRACSGGELYRQDAEFLIGEAAVAESLRLQLTACQAAYSRAQRLMQQ